MIALIGVGLLPLFFAQVLFERFIYILRKSYPDKYNALGRPAPFLDSLFGLKAIKSMSARFRLAASMQFSNKEWVNDKELGQMVKCYKLLNWIGCAVLVITFINMVTIIDFGF
jgi:hypothetical protein